MTSIAVRSEVDAAVARLVDWLETGTAPDGLLSADCFTDLTLPHWRERLPGSRTTCRNAFACWPSPNRRSNSIPLTPR